MNNNAISILILFALLIIDLLMVSTRAAFLHPHLLRMAYQHDEQHAATTTTIHLVNSLPRVKASLNLSLLINRLILGGLIIYWLSQLQLFNLGVLVGLLFLAGLVWFSCTWLVESIVNRSPDVWAIRLTPLAQLLVWILTPFVLLPLFWSGKHFAPPESTGSYLADELKTLVDAGEQKGVLEQAEGKMISSIFDMGNTLVRAIMVPRIDMQAVDVTSPTSEAIDIFLKTGHSRLPVYEETVDNIIGLLHAKDLLTVWRQDNKIVALRDLLRPAHFVPEAKRVNDLLADMQARRIHMAMVVDEYGGIAGLVTLEDIVEEILGEIQDEYDQAEEMLFQQVSENEYIFQGRVDLDELGDIMDIKMPKTEADTLAGLIYSQIGRVPVGGEVIHLGDLVLTVEEVSGNRIKQVRVKRFLPSTTEEEKHQNDNR